MVKDLLTIKETAEYLGISVGRLYNMRSAGTFPIPPARKISGIRYRKKDIEGYLDGNLSDMSTM